MTEINWTLLQELQVKPHPLIRDVPLPDNVHVGVAEILQQAKVAHHLIDMAGLDEPEEWWSYAANLDARVFRLVAAYLAAECIFGRLETIHRQETGDHGMVSGLCVECGADWPCETRRIMSE
jgi:hypothetical protein